VDVYARGADAVTITWTPGLKPASFRGDPPDYIESPVEQIVDVHWGGLAVHFGAKDGPPKPKPPPSSLPLPGTMRTRVIKTVQ
jgi:hypothetical protein